MAGRLSCNCKVCSERGLAGSTFLAGCDNDMHIMPPAT